MKTMRILIGSVLGCVVVAAFIFYWGQNTRGNLGGEISLPKMIWLAYAVFTWFLLPAILYFDTSFEPHIRKRFLLFWWVMFPRGVIELILVYGFQHWSPWYGITHDLIAVMTLIYFLRFPKSESVRSLRAQRFMGGLIVALIAETVFAAMFLQTGAHREAIYFASSSESWGFINLLTWIVLSFTVTDLFLLLFNLYFPLLKIQPRVLFHRTRICLGSLVVLVSLGALSLWIWMDRVEIQAKRYQEVGYQIIDSLTQFKKAFKVGDSVKIEKFIVTQNKEGKQPIPIEVFWTKKEKNHSHPFTLEEWHEGTVADSFMAKIEEMHKSLGKVYQAAFKIHLIDQVYSDTHALVQVRFEVTGKLGRDEGLWLTDFHREQDGRWRARSLKVIRGTSVRGDRKTFKDVALESGLDFRLQPDSRYVPGSQCEKHLCFGHPSKLKFQMLRHAYAGCSTADYDGDGNDDLFLCSGDQAALFRNLGKGQFIETTQEAGLGELWHVNTAGFADFDNDGDQDLYLGIYYGHNRLFENTGKGRYREVTETSNLKKDDVVSCFSFFDYDNDGDLDIYLGRFLDASVSIPDSFLYARNALPNILYRNDGGLKFTDVTEEAGVGDVGLTLSLQAADYDQDGDQDLYVANDFGRNVFYQNQGNGRFVDIAKENHSLAIGGSMSASWGDYNNDGRLDLYVGAIRSNQRWFVQPITAKRVTLKFIKEGKIGPSNPIFSDLKNYMGSNWVNIGNHALAGNSLLRQEEDGTFTDMAETAQARPAGWYWSSGFFDFDNDGDLDVLATNGWITGKKVHDL